MNEQGREPRDRWGSKLGVILAVAGSAVGLGNFLRFPAKAAKFGGGAFLIPYFVALFLLGLPLMWIEWTIGRFGGGFGHSTAPGMFHTLWNKNRFIKYFGVIGIFGPTVIFIYYTYIESWLLGYSLFALLGAYNGCTDQQSMSAFLQGYQGLVRNQHFGSIAPAWLFFFVTFTINIMILYKGINKGIEKVCKVGMPLLFVFALVLMIRVFTLGTPDPAKPEQNIINGLGFLWNPNWAELGKAQIWLEAAGQIFFTLSCGFGVILTYASYLSKNDDVALSGLTAAATNEVAEVIIGGSLVIPAAFVFFGPSETTRIAEGGIFNLGFVTMPLVLQKLAFGNLLGFLWFSLLFIAGITSSISLAMPALVFIEDEFNLTKKKAVLIFGAICFILTQPAIFWLGHGIVDEMDFWGGTFFVVLLALVEVILFAWIFGMDKAWTELHVGSDITIPRIYRFIIKYVTPAFLLFIIGFWAYQQWIPVIAMRGISKEDVPYVAAIRVILIGMFGVLAFSVWHVWRKKGRGGRMP